MRKDLSAVFRYCNNIIKSITEGVSTGATVELESVLNMNVETIDKLKRDELAMKKEISSHQQNQKNKLKKLIKLLKENDPVNGKNDFETDMSSNKIPVNQILEPHLQKLKATFYGFRSTNLQTRDRGGVITAERLFAESPPTSPVRGIGSINTPNVESFLQSLTINNILGPHLQKLKADFYGFQSTNPQTRDRRGVITAERLFAESPPTSPVRGTGSINTSNVKSSLQSLTINNILGPYLQKLKADFYGFRSTNPQTRDRRGIITAERLFAESPPTSPVRGTGSLNTLSEECSLKSLNINNIQHLDFVFKPLSDFSSDPISINEPRNELNRDNKVVCKLKGRIAKRNNSTVRARTSLRMKNSKKKVLNRNRKSNKLSDRVIGVEQFYKSSHLEDKLEEKLKQLPKRGIKSLFARRSEVQKLKSSNRRYLEEIYDTRENSDSVRRLSTGKLRYSCDPFGAPKKSNAESAFNDISVSSLVHSKGRAHSAVTRSIKRKFDISHKNECTENDSKVLCITNDLKASRSNHGITTRALDIGSENSGTSKVRSLPVAKVKPSTISCNQIKNSKANGSMNIISKKPLLNNSGDKKHSNNISTKLSLDNSLDMPEFNPNNAVTKYHSVIRSSTYQDFLAKYFNFHPFSKGISSRCIPHRSISEDKDRQNLFQGIYSGDKCTLISSVEMSLISKEQDSETMVKSEESEHPKPIDSSKPALPNDSTDALRRPNMDSCIPNQRIRKCSQCDFVTPKLGVLKRHELTHCKENSIQNGEMIQNSKISFFSRTLATSHPVMNHLYSSAPAVMTNNNFGVSNKMVNSQQKSISKELNSFIEFPDSSCGSPFVNRLLSVSLSPLKRKTK